jgi:hypothetical protein
MMEFKVPGCLLLRKNISLPILELDNHRLKSNVEIENCGTTGFCSIYVRLMNLNLSTRASHA